MTSAPQIQDSLAVDTSQIRLAPLYEPDAVRFTFDAPGWRVVGLMLLIVFTIILYQQVVRYIKNAYRRHALARLDGNTSPQNTLIVLKQTAIYAFGRDRAGSLTGKDWLVFLDKTGKDVDFTSLEAPIANYVYDNAEMTRDDSLKLVSNSRKWIKTHAG